MKDRIYLDYAASTPIDPEVAMVMREVAERKFGNPSSLHSFGQEAQIALDAARALCVKVLNAAFDELYFTGSATEADNWAVFGAVRKFLADNPGKVPHIICSAIEHEAILEPLKYLRDQHIIELDVVPCDQAGKISVSAVRDALRENTILVSIIYVNNEIGSVQDIPAIAAAVREYRTAHQNSYPLMHTDAVQAVQFFPRDTKALGVDMMTLSAHKLYGPKGVGILFIKKYSPLLPLLFGGGQEHMLRSGTENTAGIAGMAKALELVQQSSPTERERLGALKEFFVNAVLALDQRIAINGPAEDGAPHIANFYFPQRPADELLILLDQAGVAVSAGSACLARATKTSYVIAALNYPQADRARHSLRFSFGRETTKELLEVAVEKLRAILAPR
jgi:cysteine desulfurase